MIDNDIYEQIMQGEINKQAETDSSIDWGSDMSILLISDNAPGRAVAIKNYLATKTQISNVILSNDYEDAKKSILEDSPDAVVFIGMQTATELYKIVQMLKESFADVFYCMYAHLDPAVKIICQRYEIDNIFPDRLPVSDFVKFLQTMIERTKAKQNNV